MRRRTISVLLIAAAAAAGCGDEGRGASSEKVAADLQQAVQDTAPDVTYEDVICARRSASTYACNGDFTPSVASVRQSMEGIDTSEFTDDDWNALIGQQSGRIGYLVTVDEDTGAVVYTPS